MTHKVGWVSPRVIWVEVTCTELRWWINVTVPVSHWHSLVQITLDVFKFNHQISKNYFFMMENLFQIFFRAYFWRVSSLPLTKWHLVIEYHVKPFLVKKWLQVHAVRLHCLSLPFELNFRKMLFILGVRFCPRLDCSSDFILFLKSIFFLRNW